MDQVGEAGFAGAQGNGAGDVDVFGGVSQGSTAGSDVGACAAADLGRVVHP